MFLDLVLLAAAAALIVANAVFVAAEFSLVTVERGQVHQLAAQGDRGAASIAAAVRRLSFQLSGAQLGITVTSLLLGVIAEPAIADLLAPAISEEIAVIAGLLIATVVQMVLGELVPKNAALSRPLFVARLSVPPQRVFSAVFAPLIKVCNAIANFLVRRLGAEPQDELASARSPEELSLLLRLSAEAGTLPPSTAAVLHRALRFGDKTAAEAMTPRPRCVTVPGTANVAEFLALARATGHLRLPIMGEDIDEITAVANVPAAFAVPEPQRSTTPVGRIGRPAVLVPETLDLSSVQRRLQDAAAEMAIVVDEYSGFAGVVTVEDLVEELIGEVADEYDRPEEPSAEPMPATLAAGAQVSVPALLRSDEVAERTGFTMPHGPYETLAGLVMARLGRLPQPGEEVVVDGWTLRVDTMHRRRIEQITLTAPSADREEDR